MCKYVGTPGDDESLQDGQEPDRRSTATAADKDKDGQVFVGDQFADAQGRSVVVQIEGDDPGAESCSPTPPPVIPTTTPPTASPTAQSDGGDDAGRRRTGYGW